MATASQYLVRLKNLSMETIAENNYVKFQETEMEVICYLPLV